MTYTPSGRSSFLSYTMGGSKLETTVNKHTRERRQQNSNSQPKSCEVKQRCAYKRVSWEASLMWPSHCWLCRIASTISSRISWLPRSWDACRGCCLTILTGNLVASFANCPFILHIPHAETAKTAAPMPPEAKPNHFQFFSRKLPLAWILDKSCCILSFLEIQSVLRVSTRSTYCSRLTSNCSKSCNTSLSSKCVMLISGQWTSGKAS